MSKTDRIEKSVLLRAPRHRVWTALVEARQFGAWFRAEFEGEFTPGARVTGRSTYDGCDQSTFSVWIDEIRPESLFAFRWHPDPEPVMDADRPKTRVEFRLEDAEDGTRLTVVESGFDRLPQDRRDAALRSNTHGWTIQMDNVRAHVEMTPLADAPAGTGAEVTAAAR